MPKELNGIELAEESLLDELHSEALYNRLAKLYADDPISEKLLDFSNMEASHASFWVDFLGKRGIDTNQFSVNVWKTSFYVVLSRILGLGLTLRIIEKDERNAIKLYSDMLESPLISEEEKQGIRQIIEEEVGHEYGFVEEESRFKELLNHVGSAVTGLGGGLVQVLSVSAGLGGAYGESFKVAIGGLIVGLAGALSLGIGVFTSARAQRQVKLGILESIKIATGCAPQVYTQRVTDHMKRRQLSEAAAKIIAVEACSNPDLLSEIVAEEEYGLREEALGEPLKSGVYTGLFYLVGAIFPLIPFFTVLPLGVSILSSILIAVSMLAITGFLIALSSNLSIKRKILELILYGLGTGTVTFLIGRLASILLG